MEAQRSKAEESPKKKPNEKSFKLSILKGLLNLENNYKYDENIKLMLVIGFILILGFSISKFLAQ